MEPGMHKRCVLRRNSPYLKHIFNFSNHFKGLMNSFNVLAIRFDSINFQKDVGSRPGLALVLVHEPPAHGARAPLGVIQRVHAHDVQTEPPASAKL